MGVFRGLSVFKRARRVKMKALFQSVRVIANRKRTNKQAGVGGGTVPRSPTPRLRVREEENKSIKTGSFQIRHALWSVLEKIPFVWGQRSRMFPSTDVRLPTRCWRTRPHNKQRFYMTHHLSAYTNTPRSQKHILQPTHVTEQAGKSLHMYALKLGVFYCYREGWKWSSDPARGISSFWMMAEVTLIPVFKILFPNVITTVVVSGHWGRGCLLDQGGLIEFMNLDSP